VWFVEQCLDFTHLCLPLSYLWFQIHRALIEGMALNRTPFMEEECVSHQQSSLFPVYVES
jgi:hypothetical protein